ncbi:MAG: type IV pilin protein, partial [Gammaproteobacteria bacterium]|nr:type IV pilin protein [Gammaproteobacteria bacterium]
VGTTSANSYYNLAVANADLEGFDATATATGSQANDSLCTSFSLDEQGQRSAFGGETDNTDQCWR